MGAMAMKGCSTFPKALALLEAHYQIVGGGSYSSAEVQSVYSTSPADWAIYIYIYILNQFVCVRVRSCVCVCVHLKSEIIFIRFFFHQNFSDQKQRKYCVREI